MNLESVHQMPTVNALQTTKDANQDATQPSGGWTISRRGSEGQIPRLLRGRGSRRGRTVRGFLSQFSMSRYDQRAGLFESRF